MVSHIYTLTGSNLEFPLKYEYIVIVIIVMWLQLCKKYLQKINTLKKTTFSYLQTRYVYYLFHKGQLCTVYLRWHDFSITPCDFDSCVQACPVVGLDDVTAVHLIGSHTTVVGTWKHKNQVKVNKGQFLLHVKEVIEMEIAQNLCKLEIIHAKNINI